MKFVPFNLSWIAWKSTVESCIQLFNSYSMKGLRVLCWKSWRTQYNNNNNKKIKKWQH